MENDNKQIAEIILEQLGGRRFARMTGAKSFMAIDRGLQFKLPGAGGFTKNGINLVQIDLRNDLYNLKFSRVRAGVVKLIKAVDGVYNDQLRDIFEEVTGLIPVM